MTDGRPNQPKDLHWIGSSRKDLKAFPETVQDDFGHELRGVQLGGMPRCAKVLKGFGAADVLELVDDHDSDTYRAVYTVRFRRAIYVLHAFKKKSRHGVKTPEKDLALVKSRLRTAAEDYAGRYRDER